jgi:hypothetical protein
MSDLKTTVPFTSITTPGITGVVRKITFGARNALRKRLAAINERRTDLQLDRSELVDELAALHEKKPEDLKFGELTEREWVRHNKVSSQIEICDEEITAAHLEEGFVSLSAIDGNGKPDVVTIDGEPVTRANLSKLPPELAQELVQAILASSQVSGDAAKNSQSPSTSGGVEGSATNDSTAASAGAKGSTEPASAANTQS